MDNSLKLGGHEACPVCWVVSVSNERNDRMSNGDSKGTHPIFDEVIKIISVNPMKSLRQENGFSTYSHGGFVSIETARYYIEGVLKGREIPDEFLKKIPRMFLAKENMELFTVAPYNGYHDIEDYWCEKEISVTRGLWEVEEIVKRCVKEENKKGYGFLGTVEDIMKFLLDISSINSHLQD